VQSQHRGAFGEQLGPQPLHRSFQHGFAEFVDRQPFQAARAAYRVAEVDQHDDPRRRSLAKAGDVADPNGHRELVAKERLKEHATSQSAGHGQHHQQRIGQAMVRQIKNQQDDNHHYGEISHGLRWVWISCSNWPVHSTYTPDGSDTWPTTRLASSTNSTVLRS
jgi:hypothetical protein